MRARLRLSTPIASALLASCTDFGDSLKPVQVPEPPPEPVATVVILAPVGAASEVEVGGFVQFAAEARDAGGARIDRAPLVWSSSDPTVATIDATGRATGVMPGTTSVQAESRGRRSSAVELRVRTTQPPPDFATEVQPIFEDRCVECHGKNGGLDLAADRSYDNLVNERSIGSALLRVEPGNPDRSYLVVKIEGPCPGPRCSGGRMPFERPPLEAAQIRTIREWIAAGAPR